MVAHFSDPHLLADDSAQYGVVDPEPDLQLALERLDRLDPPPQALVFTGDLADKAEPAAYARLRELVEPAAERFGAQVVWVMGNHDERAPYAARAVRHRRRRAAGPGRTTSTGCGSSRSTPACRATTTAS